MTITDLPKERVHEVATLFSAACVKEVGGRRVSKNGHPLHMGVAGALDIIGSVKEVALSFGIDIPLAAPSGEDYKKDFATTIGNEIAIPDEWDDVSCILAMPHECLHVRQHKKGVDSWGLPKITTHSILYLLGVIFHDAAGEEYVGKVEGDAYAVSQVVRKFLTGRAEDLPTAVAPLIQSYNLLNVGPATARGILASHLATMDTGLVPNVSMAQFAWDWLNTNAADLKGAFRF